MHTECYYFELFQGFVFFQLMLFGNFQITVLVFVKLIQIFAYFKPSQLSLPNEMWCTLSRHPIDFLNKAMITKFNIVNQIYIIIFKILAKFFVIYLIFTTRAKLSRVCVYLGVFSTRFYQYIFRCLSLSSSNKLVRTRISV